MRCRRSSRRSPRRTRRSGSARRPSRFSRRSRTVDDRGRGKEVAMGEAAMTRRGFVGGVAAGVGLALSLSPARGQGAPARRALPNTVRLGGPSFSKAEDPAELARAHRKLGYRAAYCPAIKLADRERIRDTEE